MAHYIIQDAYSGYIWGDTRDIDGKSVNCETIVDACRAVDLSISGVAREYQEVSRLNGDTGYLVYRADINGSEAVGDGQDREIIQAVERDCDLVGYVEFRDAEAA